MGTRSQIGFYEEPIIDIKKDIPHSMLYKHWDGYPSGTFPIILKFLLRYFKKVRNGRGHHEGKFFDMDSTAAWFLYYLLDTQVKRAIEHYKKDHTYPEDGMEMDGAYGICGNKDFHGDIDYYYAFTTNEMIVYDWGSKPKEILRIKYNEVIKASKNKPKGSYKFNDITPYLSGIDFTYTNNDTSYTFKEYRNRKIKALKELFDIRDVTQVLDYYDKDDQYTLLSIHLYKVLDMKFEDLPTMINIADPILKGIVKYRLEKRI